MRGLCKYFNCVKVGLWMTSIKKTMKGLGTHYLNCKKKRKRKTEITSFYCVFLTKKLSWGCMQTCQSAMCIVAGCAWISMQHILQSFTPGCAAAATGRWISLIKCSFPHMCLMNKDTSLLSGTHQDSRFLSTSLQKSVKPASQMKRSFSVKYAGLRHNKA